MSGDGNPLDTPICFLYNKSMSKNESILDEAQRLTSVDRQAIYGHPADDFDKVAQMIEPIMNSDIDRRLKHALYMVQVKVARLLNTPDHHDSIVDLAGYANTYDMVMQKIKKEKENETKRTIKPELRGNDSID